MLSVKELIRAFVSHRESPSKQNPHSGDAHLDLDIDFELPESMKPKIDAKQKHDPAGDSDESKGSPQMKPVGMGQVTPDPEALTLSA